MKKRKSYGGPKYVAKNPMATFFGGMSDTHAEHLQKTNIINHGALAALARGIGGKDEWDRMVGAVNIANIMSEQGIGDEFRTVFLRAREALVEVGIRSLARGGRFLFTGDELQAMNEAMACHDAQLENIRAIDIDRAADEVARRLRHQINSTSISAEMAKRAKSA